MYQVFNIFESCVLALPYNKQSMLQYLLSARRYVSQVSDNVHISICYSPFVDNINIFEKKREMSSSV